MSDDFNPRSHERSDPCEPIEFLKRYCISIHAPTRGATGIKLNCNIYTFISIHAPTRGATVRTIKAGFTPSISIHAPTRGATSDIIEIVPTDEISIHAPTRGATINHVLKQKRGLIFQSTLPREERPPAPKYRKYYDKISIHAPTRGATQSAYTDQRRHRISIHAPTRGATFYLLNYKPIMRVFQSTLPREERRGYVCW